MDLDDFDSGCFLEMDTDGNDTGQVSRDCER